VRFGEELQLLESVAWIQFEGVDGFSSGERAQQAANKSISEWPCGTMSSLTRRMRLFVKISNSHSSESVNCHVYGKSTSAKSRVSQKVNFFKSKLLQTTNP